MGLLRIPIGTRLGGCRAPAVSFAEADDGIILRIDGMPTQQDGTHLVTVCFFPVTGATPPLCHRINILLSEKAPTAFYRDFDRLFDGLSMWDQAGIELRACYDGKDALEVALPKSVADASLHEGEAAISAGIYYKNYEDVFWARCRGRGMITAEVPIGRLSLYSGAGIASMFMEFSFATCVVASDDANFLASLLMVFERSATGIPMDCDDRMIRNYLVAHESPGVYVVEVDGTVLERGLSREGALGRFVQDMTDWVVSSLVGAAPAAHASSNLSPGGAVLCMGYSGSGKTSLALALARYWPLRGDECAFVDFENCMTWAEPMPVNVKEGNAFALGLTEPQNRLCCASGLHGKTFYCSRRIVDSDADSFLPVRIRAVVFPSHDAGVPEVQLSRPAHDSLVPLVLGSLVSTEAPSASLGMFLKMVSSYGIDLLAVRFSDADQAAKAIVGYFDGKEH